MDHNDIRTLKILEEIDKGYVPSQRDLANELNISLGLVNSFIKRLANKGYFKIVNIQKNRVKYLLTPHGVAEKTRLTYEYVTLSYQFYTNARQKLRDLFHRLETYGVSLLIFYGASDLAEIAFITLQGTPLRMVAVVDDYKAGEIFLHTKVVPPVELDHLFYDRILITAINSRNSIVQKILERGIPEEKIAMLE